MFPSKQRRSRESSISPILVPFHLSKCSLETNENHYIVEIKYLRLTVKTVGYLVFDQSKTDCTI